VVVSSRRTPRAKNLKGTLFEKFEKSRKDLLIPVCKTLPERVREDPPKIDRVAWRFCKVAARASQDCLCPHLATPVRPQKSLCCELEPALIGVVAHGFYADFSQGDNQQAPNLEEARAFIREYERARGTKFPAQERRLCGAFLVYASAYRARCNLFLNQYSGWLDVRAAWYPKRYSSISPRAIAHGNSIVPGRP
jgi:hypothetical protein